MSTHSDSFLTWIAKALARYSLVIYLGGLLVVALPTILRRINNISLSLQFRRVLIGSALGLMILAYLAERRYRESETVETRSAGDSGRIGEVGYSLYARLSLVGAAGGVAVGIYLIFALDRLLVGMLFVGGAYLFVRMGYRHEERKRRE